MTLRLVSLVGVFVFVGCAWLLSVNRRGVRWRPVVWGIGLQLVLGAIVLAVAWTLAWGGPALVRLVWRVGMDPRRRLGLLDQSTQRIVPRVSRRSGIPIAAGRRPARKRPEARGREEPKGIAPSPLAAHGAVPARWRARRYVSASNVSAV